MSTGDACHPNFGTGFPRDLNKMQMLMEQACDLGPWASHLTSTQGNYLRNLVQLLSGQTRISAARLPRKTMRAMSPLKQPCFSHQGGCSVQAEFQYSSCVVQVPGPCVCSGQNVPQTPTDISWYSYWTSWSPKMLSHVACHGLNSHEWPPVFHKITPSTQRD